MPDAPARLSLVQAAGMLVAREANEEEQLAIERLKGVHCDIQKSAALFEELARMLR